MRNTHQRRPSRVSIFCMACFVACSQPEKSPMLDRQIQYCVYSRKAILILFSSPSLNAAARSPSHTPRVWSHFETSHPSTLASPSPPAHHLERSPTPYSSYRTKINLPPFYSIHDKSNGKNPNEKNNTPVEILCRDGNRVGPEGPEERERHI